MDFIKQTTGNQMNKTDLIKLGKPVLDILEATLVNEPKSNDHGDPLTVERTNGNHIYYYSGVNSDRGLALMKEIRDADTMLQQERGQRQIPDDHPQTPIWLHIQSGGGGVFAGLAIADQLKQIRTPIYSIVEGYCASAATLISMACTKRFIQPSAFMLVHQLSSIAWGTYEQLKDDMHINDMLMDQLVQFYTNHTKLTEEKVRGIMKRDSWFKASECLENGFVDEVIQ